MFTEIGYHIWPGKRGSKPRTVRRGGTRSEPVPVGCANLFTAPNSTTRRQGFKSDPPQPAPSLRAGGGRGRPHGQTLAQARRSPALELFKQTAGAIHRSTGEFKLAARGFLPLTAPISSVPTESSHTARAAMLGQSTGFGYSFS